MLFLGGGAVGGTFWYFKSRKKTEEAKPLVIRMDEVKRGELSEVVQAPGEIQPKTKVSISARVSARIASLPYKEGDTVAKGGETSESASVLVRLDATDLQAALRSAKAKYEAQKAQIQVALAQIAAQESQLSGSKASLVEAEKQLSRSRQLREHNRVSDEEYEQAALRVQELRAQYQAAVHSLQATRQNLSVLQHNLDAADAEIAKAKDNLSYSELTSPIDGVVTRLNAKEGELVVTGTMNNPGTVIMEVADLSSMILVAKVDEADICRIRPGQRAFVRVQAYPDRLFMGTVSTVALASTGDKDTPKHFKSEIALETNGDRLYSGLTADVDIETSRYTSALLVPSQSVMARKIDELPAQVRDDENIDKRKSMATVVYRVEKDKTVVTPIKIGPSDTTNTLVVSGLSLGQRIVTGPYKILEKLEHDQKVEEEKKGEKPASATTTKKTG